MRPERVLRYLALYGLAVGLGASVSSSCISVNYPTVAFRCNPRQDDNCPESHFCCSDDPAALGSGGEAALPAYAGTGVQDGGEPLFSAANNDLSASGMCVRVDDIPPGAGLQEPAAFGCPIPCNPTWSNAQVRQVCGSGRSCCQTAELAQEDCVLDDGMWRPVTGADIFTDPQLTNWSRGSHETHQDPGAEVCLSRGGGEVSSEVFRSCARQLSVGNQRGYCMDLDGGLCPTNPMTGYVDACTALNQDAEAGT